MELKEVCNLCCASLLLLLFSLCSIGIAEGKEASSVVCSVERNEVNIYDTIKVYGQLNPPHPGAEIDLIYFKPDGTKGVEKVILSRSSSFLMSLRLDQTGYWKILAYWPGDEDHDSATSEPIVVLVKEWEKGVSRIEIWRTTPSAPVGTPIELCGEIVPPHSSSVTIEFSLDGFSWNKLVVVNSSQDGSFSYTWIPTKKGEYMFRAHWPGDEDHKGNVSNIINISIWEEVKPVITSRMSVEVKDEAWRPIAKANITLTSDHGIFVKFSDERGMAEFEVPVAKYILRVEKEGYRSYEELLDLSKPVIAGKVVQLTKIPSIEEAPLWQQYWFLVVLTVAISTAIFLVLKLKKSHKP